MSDSIQERERLVIGVGDGIVKPKLPFQEDIAPPEQNLKLKAVFGFNGDLRHNLVYNNREELVYAAASFGVIQDHEGNQKFHVGHNLNISAITIDKRRKYVATGEVEIPGKPPVIRIWNAETGVLQLEIPSELNRSNSSFGHLLIGRIKSLSFSPDGSKLVAFGDDTNHSVTLLQSRAGWSSYKRIFNKITTKNEVEFIEWLDKERFYTGGYKHVYLWNITQQDYKIVKFGHCPIDHITCGVVIDQLLICGTLTGNIITIYGDMVGRYKKVHKHSVNVICRFGDGYISSGDEKGIIYWNMDGKPLYGWDLTKMIKLVSGTDEFRLGNIKSMTTVNNKIAIGDNNNNIFEINIIGKKLVSANLVVHQGANKRIINNCIPSPINNNTYIITSEDKKLYIMDIEKKYPRKIIKLPDHCTSVCYHPKKDIVCITLDIHEITDNDNNTETKSNFILIDLITYNIIYTSFGISDDTILISKFSPNGKYLTLGTNNNTLYTYDLSTPDVKLYGEFNELTTPVLYIDYTIDSRIIKIQTTDDTIYYLHVERCKQIVLASDISDKQWATTTCLKSYDVKGLLHNDKLSSKMKLCTSNDQKTLLLCIDKYDKIKLYRYPVIDETCMYKSFGSHSGKISYAAFTNNGLSIMTFSKDEGTVLFWGFK